MPDGVRPKNSRHTGFPDGVGAFAVQGISAIPGISARSVISDIHDDDLGVSGGPDLDYEKNTEGLAVAVPVAGEDDSIPEAVEYDPDAKPPLYRNRRFRLYSLLAFFPLKRNADPSSDRDNCENKKCK